MLRKNAKVWVMIRFRVPPSGGIVCIHGIDLRLNIPPEGGTLNALLRCACEIPENSVYRLLN
jgi:hypothetical protein